MKSTGLIHGTEIKEKQYKCKLKLEKAKANPQKRCTGPEYFARTHMLCGKGETIECFFSRSKGRGFYALQEYENVLKKISRSDIG